MATEAKRQVAAVKRWHDNNVTGIYGVVEFGGDPRQQPVNHTLSIVRRALIESITDGTYGHWCEIGPGGGRWTREFADALLYERLHHLTLIDGGDAGFGYIQKMCMLPPERLTCHVCPDGLLDSGWSFDGVFSYGVFCHFHLELFRNYIESLSRNINTKGKLIFEYGRRYPNSANWREGPKYQWFYYDDDTIERMLNEHGFHIDTYIELDGGWGQRLLFCHKK